MAKGKSHLIFGKHPVTEALQAGKPFDKVFLQQGIRGPLEKEIRQLCKTFKVPLQVIPKERLDRLAGGNHQGVAGYAALVRYQQLEDVLPFLFEQDDLPLVLLIDGVTDVRNFGSIARSAECCGVGALVVPRKGSAQVNAEAVKSSAGALLRIPICRETSIAAAVELLQLSGVPVFASDLQADGPIMEMDFSGPVALVLGAEGEGVSEGVLRRVDKRFVIPQRGETDSFNVAVAAGIMLYEVLRQRG